MSNEELLAAMQGLVAPIVERLDKLEKAVEEGPGETHINTSGRQIHMHAARSVTIATRPVVDSPNDPRWAGQIADSVSGPPREG